MEVSNLAVAALFEALERNNFDRELLLTGTNLKLNFMLDVKNNHSWFEFVKMYKNVENLLGPDLAAREIAYTGLYNENLSTFRKIGTGLLDVKTGYWFLSIVGCRHLFKDTVKFKYKKIKSNTIEMEVSISPELEECPLLFETYKYLFENVPTVLGLAKAKVDCKISKKNAIYTISFIQTSYFKVQLAKLLNKNSYEASILLMEELETQSIQLSKLLKEKSELLQIISHDIANRISIVDMSLDYVLTKGKLDDSDKTIIQKAKKNSQQLGEILRSTQKLELAHTKGIDLEAVEIGEVFNSIEIFFKTQMASKNISLICLNHIPPHLKVMAEKSSLEMSVLSNLISNAIKFSPNGSSITMEATVSNGGKAIISVTDQGIGMPSEERENLFKKKHRTSTLGTNGEQGTGFGLGIVNKYVQMYNGNISVEPNFPRGTKFIITLNLSRA